MKPEKKLNNVTNRKKTPKKKGNNNILIIGIAAIILIGALVLLMGNSQKTEPTQKMTLKEVRALIDKEYGNKAPGTNTPAVKDNYLPILLPRKADKLPDFAVTNAMTLKAYKYATEHPEVLEQIPCYCGCGQHGSVTSGGKPHMSVRDCFISNDGVYDDHASFCDVCVGIATKAQSYFPTGIPDTGLSAIKATPAPSTDLSVLSLPDNFKSLADGLKLTPAGVNRAYFVNTKMLAGTEIEAQILQQVEPDGFYGKKLIGMYSADFSTNSWIELHDLGYDSKNDANIKGRIESGMKNIVITRPLIYGHSQNVDNVLKLINDPNSMTASYSTYKPLLDAVDYQNAAYALVLTEKTSFSDINYESLTPVGAKLDLVKAYRLTENKSIPEAFNKYNPQITGNILVMKVSGDLKTIQAEKDNIDAVART